MRETELWYVALFFAGAWLLNLAGVVFLLLKLRGLRDGLAALLTATQRQRDPERSHPRDSLLLSYLIDQAWRLYHGQELP